MNSAAHFVHATDQQVTVTTVANEEISGILKSWTAGEVAITNDDKSISLSSDQLLAIRWQTTQQADKPSTSMLELVDGTRLPFSEYKVEDRQALVTTPLKGKPLSIPTSEIHRVQFSPQSAAITQLWQQLEEKQLDGDVLVIQKKEAGALDYLTGVLGDAGSDQLEFNWDGEDISVKRSKVAALEYYHARLPEIREAVCWVGTSNGASLPVASLSIEEGVVRITTTSDLEFLVALDTLQTADYSAGKLTYLSDLEPIRTTWTPLVEFPASASIIREFGVPRSDQSFGGSHLSLVWPRESQKTSRGGGADRELKMYSKGLAIRSQTELLYRLPPKMQHFAAITGIDPATAGQGNVRLEIYADDAIAWEGEISGEAAPVEIQFEIDGTEQLRIFVDYGANLDFGDRLHLVNARVTK